MYCVYYVVCHIFGNSSCCISFYASGLKTYSPSYDPKRNSRRDTVYQPVFFLLVFMKYYELLYTMSFTSIASNSQSFTLTLESINQSARRYLENHAL